MSGARGGPSSIFDPRSCFLCQKQGIKCDGLRPCSQCSAKGTPHMCLGSELQSRLPLNSNSSTSHSFNSSHHFKPKNNSIHSTPSQSNSTQATHHMDTDVAAVDHQSLSMPPASPPHSSYMTTNPKRTKKRKAGDHESQHTDDPFSPASGALAKSSRNHSLYDPNSLSNELAKLRMELASIKTENVNLRMQNEKLNSQVLKMAEGYHTMSQLQQYLVHLNILPPSTRIQGLINGGSGIGFEMHDENQTSSSTGIFESDDHNINDTHSLHQHPSSSSSKGSSFFPISSLERATLAPFEAFRTASLRDKNLPIVLFDLSKNPPVIALANEAFCNLFPGIPPESFPGLPWHTFIHPDYLDRTANILYRTSRIQQNHQRGSTGGGGAVKFTQVYANKAPSFSNTSYTQPSFQQQSQQSNPHSTSPSNLSGNMNNVVLNPPNPHYPTSFSLTSSDPLIPNSPYSFDEFSESFDHEGAGIYGDPNAASVYGNLNVLHPTSSSPFHQHILDSRDKTRFSQDINSNSLDTLPQNAQFGMPNNQHSNASSGLSHSQAIIRQQQSQQAYTFVAVDCHRFFFIQDAAMKTTSSVQVSSQSPDAEMLSNQNGSNSSSSNNVNNSSNATTGFDHNNFGSKMSGEFSANNANSSASSGSSLIIMDLVYIYVDPSLDYPIPQDESFSVLPINEYGMFETSTLLLPLYNAHNPSSSYPLSLSGSSGNIYNASGIYGFGVSGNGSNQNAPVGNTGLVIEEINTPSATTTTPTSNMTPYGNPNGGVQGGVNPLGINSNFVNSTIRTPFQQQWSDPTGDTNHHQYGMEDGNVNGEQGELYNSENPLYLSEEQQPYTSSYTPYSTTDEMMGGGMEVDSLRLSNRNLKRSSS